MAVYFADTTGGVPSPTNIIGVRGNTDGTIGPFIGMLRVTCTSVVAATPANRWRIRQHTTGFVNAGASEKRNTRSSASAGLYNDYVGTGNDVVEAGLAQFNPSGWIAMPRWCPMSYDDANVAVCLVVQSSHTISAFNTGISVIENAQGHTWTRGGRMRRTRKPGFWNLMGNVINRCTTTGGSAFSAIYPQFQNDMMWVDQSAWRNGHFQGISTNPSLAGVATRQRMLMGTGM